MLARGGGLGGPREVCGRGAREVAPVLRGILGPGGWSRGWLARGPSGSHNGTMGRRAGPTGISTGVLGGRGWRWKLAAVTAGVALTWTAFCPQDSTGGEDAVAATDGLVNRPWLNRMPTGERDTIFHLALLKHPKGRVGAAGHSSQWRHRIEVMRWRLKDGNLGVRFPQDGAKGELGVKTWKCGGEAPAPFDLCLEISNDDRVMTLYSREDWEIRVDPKSGALDVPTSPAPYPTHAALDVEDLSSLLGEAQGSASARGSEEAPALDVVGRFLDGTR